MDVRPPINAWNSLFAILSMVFYAHNVSACTPRSDWKRPTLREAYEKAEVVVHARVISQETIKYDGPYSRLINGTIRSKVETLRVVKGTFTKGSVSTAPPERCGSSLIVGKEYVFFFQADRFMVDPSLQPWDQPTEKLLEEILGLLGIVWVKQHDDQMARL